MKKKQKKDKDLNRKQVAKQTLACKEIFKKVEKLAFMPRYSQRPYMSCHNVTLLKVSLTLMSKVF